MAQSGTAQIKKLSVSLEIASKEGTKELVPARVSRKFLRKVSSKQGGQKPTGNENT